MSVATELMAATSIEEALLVACRALLTYDGAVLSHGSYVPANQDWSRGYHFRHDGVTKSPSAISALFALQRRLCRERKTLCLRREADTENLFVHLGEEAPGNWLHVAPIYGRRRQVLGLVAILHERELSPDQGAALEHIASMLTAAVGNLLLIAHARRDQDRLHLLAEATHEALWDWTLATDDVWWGGGIQNLLGAGGETVQPNSAWRFERVHPDDRARVERSLRSAIESTDSVWQEEYRFRRADGSWLNVEDRAYFLRDPDSRAYRLIGSIRDVSPIKALLAREQRARSEAEAASRAKDEFLAMLSHELRNPLAPIVAALDVIRVNGYSDRVGRVIDRQARHLVRLVDDLMDISRITRGKIELRTERAPLELVTSRAVEMTRPLFLERRQTLTVSITPEDLAVDGDVARLAQVLGNLLTNAAKYTEPGGQVSVTAARSQCGKVVIRVRDNGIGISPAILPQVFDLFVQESQALDRSRGGLGLGLAIVKNLVESHGGKVSAHSEGRGHGSEFTIELPEAAPIRSEGDGEPVNDVRPSAPAPASARVLIVDDNVDAAEILSDVLRMSGLECKVAANAQQGLEAAAIFEPHIAILDIGLPGMNGYELAQRLRRAHPNSKILALSGYGREVDKKAAVAAGFDEHLTKPVDAQTLLKTLSGLVSAS